MNMLGIYTAQKFNQVLVDAGIPIHGVSIGRVDDKESWRIDFKEEATPAQKAQAQQILNDFDESQIPDPVSEMQAEINTLKSQMTALEAK